MRIDRYERISKDKYRLFLDNGEVLDLYEDVILEDDLLYNKNIDSVKYDNINNDNVIAEFYHNCLSYIKSRLRSEKEIRNYLIKKKASDEQINKVVNKLKKNNIINDDYFCKCFIHDKMMFSMQGEYKIILELRNAGIDENIIQNNYNLFDKEIMREKINKLIEKYLKSDKKNNGFKLKNKIYTNLMNQGFSKDMILEILSSYEF